MNINLKHSFNSSEKQDRHIFLMIRFGISYCIFLFVILFLTVYLHHITTISTEKDFWTQNKATFTNSVSLLDNHFSTMDSVSRNLASDSNFYQLARMTSNMQDDFYLSGLSMKRSLASYTAYTNLPINSCFVYLRNTEYVISNNTFNSETLYYTRNYSQQMEDGYSNWHALLNAPNASGRMYSLNDYVVPGNDNEYLFLLDMDALTYRDIPATIGFHISGEKLESIFHGLSLDNGAGILCLDESQNPVFFTGSNANSYLSLCSELSNLSYLDDYADFAFQSQEMHVTKATSTVQPWTLYLIQPDSLYPVTYQWIFYLALLLAFLLGFIFICILVRNNIRPIIYLDDQLQETILEKDQLIEEANAIRPIIYSNYLRQLMSGSVTSSDELSFIQNYLHLEDSSLQYFVMYGIIYENEFVETAETSSETDNLENINETIRQLLADYFSFENTLYLYSPQKRVYSILLPFHGDSQEQLIHIQEKVLNFHNYVLDHYDIWFFTGIGLPCSFSNIWESYQQAKDVSGYTTKNYIFLPYEMLKKDSHVYYYPAEFSSRLIRSITSGNKEQVMEILDLIHQENIEERSLPFQLLHFLLTDMRNTLLKARFAYQEDGNDTPALLDEIDSLLSSEELTFRLCKDISLKLCDLFDSNAERNSLIDTIVTYIRTNYKNPALCLSKISDEFHISESYFSHMFKENMNVNFSVYLEDLRLTEAARLIRDGSFGLTEIAMEVGYNNQTSFRRAFKKKFGVTPSNYN